MALALFTAVAPVMTAKILAVYNAAFSMLKAFGRLVSADYRRISRGQKYHIEHKLKTAIRRKKEALGIKESHIDYPNY